MKKGEEGKDVHAPEVRAMRRPQSCQEKVPILFELEVGGLK